MPGMYGEVGQTLLQTKIGFRRLGRTTPNSQLIFSTPPAYHQKVLVW